MGNKPRIRFKGFTEDWEQRKLGDLAEIVRGASPRPISDPKWFDNNSNVGWLRIADVTAQDGRIRYLEQKISELGQEKTRVIKTPHLLLSIAATVGKPVINYVPTGVHDGFLIFLNPKFNILYTFWWLEMFREKWNKYGQPGSQVNLNSDLVKNQVINIPNEKEQEKISSFLEALDKIITLHQCKLEKLKLTKKALLQKLFPKNGKHIPEIRFKGFTDAWEQRKLIYIFNDFIVPMRDKPKVFSGTTPWTRIEDIEGRYINTSLSGQFVSDETIKSMNLKVIPKGSLIVSASATFGVVAIVNNDLITNQTFIGLVPNKDFDIDFLYSLFEAPTTKGKLLKLSAGSTIFYIARESFENLVLSVPSKEEQIKISKVFKSIDDSITLHQRKLERLQEVKKGLLQKMFV